MDEYVAVRVVVVLREDGGVVGDDGAEGARGGDGEVEGC